MNLPSGLGPGAVGVRVVVRRLLPGQVGPTGGPAMTDLLGVLEEWGDTTITVRAEDGTPVVIDRALIVAGKPVPPRPRVRLRVTPDEAQRRAVASWPAVETAWLGDWLLRASGGYSGRANSALLIGEPDRPVPEALAEVGRFYEARGLPTWVQVVVGSGIQVALAEAGWVTARAGEADTLFEMAGVAAALRVVRREAPADPLQVTVATRLDGAWLADDTRARVAPEAARAVLEGPEQVAFVSAGEPPVARVRVAVTGDADPWAGLTALSVARSHQGRGLAPVVLRHALTWAAERGATTAYLQVLADNEPALRLYNRLGFTAHHAYRYLRPPD